MFCSKKYFIVSCSQHEIIVKNRGILKRNYWKISQNRMCIHVDVSNMTHCTEVYLIHSHLISSGVVHKERTERSAKWQTGELSGFDKCEMMIFMLLSWFSDLSETAQNWKWLFKISIYIILCQLEGGFQFLHISLCKVIVTNPVADFMKVCKYKYLTCDHLLFIHRTYPLAVYI